jgi:hypothetical protein
VTPFPRPYDESGRLHYFHGHLTESEAPGKDIEALEEMIERHQAQPLDPAVRDDYAIGLYWPPEDGTVQILFEKGDLNPVVRSSAEAAFRAWGEEKGWNVEILDGKAEDA